MVSVDARWMVGNFRGMGRYAHALLEPVAGKVTALLPSGFPQANYPSIYNGNGFFPWWEQIVLPRLCAERGVTRLLCPYNTAPIRLPASTELVLVVHDLIYLEPWTQLQPSVSAYQTFGRVYRRRIVPLAVERATKLVTCSEYTRDQISMRFSIRKESIRVIPNSLDDAWYVDPPLPLEARQPYVLAVTGEAPNKNLTALIRAFAKFRAKLGTSATNVYLRIVGIKQSHQNYFIRLAEKVGVNGCIRFEPFVDEFSLKRLYREAWLFTMPSLYEGFGIPVLEAMASGTPVACSNSTSLPEVVHDAGWLFDPRSDDDIAEKMSEAWSDAGGRSEKIRLGLKRADVYRRTVVGKSIADFWSTL